MMHSLTFSAAVVAALASGVLGHGLVTTPNPRQYGAVAEASCGEAVYDELTSDLFGPIENAVKKIDDEFVSDACPLFFCRGTSIEDNANNTRSFAVGEVVNFLVDLEARHTGFANVSVVDLTTQSTIGTPLFNWPVYANDSLGPSAWPTNETDFNVTIPDLEGRCSKVGACAIQWWWFGTQVQQTYESCVDFTQ